MPVVAVAWVLVERLINEQLDAKKRCCVLYERASLLASLLLTTISCDFVLLYFSHSLVGVLGAFSPAYEGAPAPLQGPQRTAKSSLCPWPRNISNISNISTANSVPTMQHKECHAFRAKPLPLFVSCQDRRDCQSYSQLANCLPSQSPAYSAF